MGLLINLVDSLVKCLGASETALLDTYKEDHKKQKKRSVFNYNHRKSL